jgi:hypothetical protein
MKNKLNKLKINLSKKWNKNYMKMNKEKMRKKGKKEEEEHR